jgi:hypothetical protein
MANTTTTSNGIVVYNNPATGGTSVGSSDAVVASEGVVTTEAPSPLTATSQTGVDQATGVINAVDSQFNDLTGQSISSVASAQNLIDNPSGFLTPETSNSSIDTTIDGSSGMMDASNPNYALESGSGGLNVDVATGTATTVSPNVVSNPGATIYDAATSSKAIDEAIDKSEAPQGEFKEEGVVEAPLIDMKGVATGYNADGTVNYTGKAASKFASQNISTIIDTSTVAGKMLAQELGEGNYLDSKATVMGQMDIISQSFVGPDGQPKIPSWAQSIARSTKRSVNLSGLTGTAATAVMSTAIMEATLPIAQDEATLFQTLVRDNLSNRQEMTINRANVLSNIEMSNQSAQITANVETAKNFMSLDLKNLDGEQQMAVIDMQSRVQSILEDSKQENLARQFAAKSIMDMEKYYDNISAQIIMQNSTELNAMERHNSGEINATNQFNAELEDSREKWYADMQYTIDNSNTTWRREITLEESRMNFEAASRDVQNMFDMSVEAQNQLWDRADAILDYIWKSSETGVDREYRLAEARITGAATRSAGRASAAGSIAGAVIGAVIM